MLGKFFAEFIYKRKFGSPYEKNGYLRFLEHIAIVTNRGTWYENEMRQTQQQDNQELQRLLDELSDGEHDQDEEDELEDYQDQDPNQDDVPDSDDPDYDQTA